MSLKSIASLLGFCAALSACAMGEPLAEGQQRMLIGIPRASDCDLQGDNLVVEKNQNIMGKGLIATGDISGSVLVCTNADGLVLKTTDHTRLMARAPTANVIIYTIKPGVTRASGSQTIRSQQFEFWADFIFVPAA